MTNCAHQHWRSAGLPAFLVAVCLGLSIPAQGQANPAESPATNVKPPQFPVAFAVASVKPSQPDCRGMSVSPSPGRLSAQCITLQGLVSNAYAIKSQDSIPGMPNWGTSALFDVDAKVDDQTAAALDKLPRDEQWKLTRQMVQAFLADRFKLHVHNETRKEPIYVLNIARGGPKLKDAAGSQSSAADSWGNGRIQIHKGTVGSLVAALTDIVGRPVVDKTGLTGSYDIDVTWIPESQQGGFDAELATALEGFGLKLESTKGPVDVFVIDHAERP